MKNSALKAALARHRAISIAALIVLTILAWGWLLSGAAMNMEPLVSLAPITGDHVGATGMDMANQSGWSAGKFTLIFSMWWVMMLAMMLPSAAPMILLYTRVVTGEHGKVRPATGSFLAGYLLAWGAFSLAATVLQSLLERSEFLSPMTMAAQSHLLSAAILISAGIYQLSPFKDVCLRHCRSPAQFLSLNYRPGTLGAIRLGFAHGGYCVGCCWLLMTLLFVGGVMNLAWIALLTLMVAAEKLLPMGRNVSFVTGLACIAWGSLILYSVAVS